MKYVDETQNEVLKFDFDITGGIQYKRYLSIKQGYVI